MMSLDLRPDLRANPYEVADLAASNGTLIQGTLAGIGLISDATESGTSAVELLITTPDGKTITAHTTLALYASAARALLSAPISVAEGHDPRRWGGQ